MDAHISWSISSGLRFKVSLREFGDESHHRFLRFHTQSILPLRVVYTIYITETEGEREAIYNTETEGERETDRQTERERQRQTDRDGCRKKTYSGPLKTWTGTSHNFLESRHVFL